MVTFNCRLQLLKQVNTWFKSTVRKNRTTETLHYIQSAIYKIEQDNPEHFFMGYISIPLNSPHNMV